MKKKSRKGSEEKRIKRHYRIRKTVFGTDERPRLSIHRSHKNLYVQFINDIANITLLSLSTNDLGFKKEYRWGGNIESARRFGGYIYREAKKKNISKVVFDRGGYLYHGRIKAVADSVREAGLRF